MRLRIILIFLILLAFFPVNRFIHAEDSAPTAGFIPKNIWYSKDPFFEGDTVKIYTIVFNTEKSPISGKVTFYDKDAVLGSRTVTVNPESFQSVTIDWKVTAGDHSINALISDTKMIISGESQAITLSNKKTETDEKFVAKKIIPKVSDEKAESEIGKTITNTVSDIGDFISNETPAKTWIDKIDEYRTSVASHADIEKKVIKDNIEKEEVINDSSIKKGTNTASETNSPKRAFEYVKLFFYSLVSFIFTHKILFYILLVVLIFFILRFIYRMIMH